MAVGAHLRRLVENAEHFVEPEIFLLRHRGDHDARAGRTDRRRQFALGKTHEAGIGRQLAPVGQTACRGMCRQLLAGANRTKKAFKQGNQLRLRGVATPQPGIGRTAGIAEDIDKTFGLPGFGSIRP